MCLVAFALSLDPSVPLWLASNRDERWGRPTTPLHRWTLPNGVSVIGGRDEQDGGTWLAASEHGRIAWLTNVREAERPAAERSRGGLVTDWLASDEPWERWHLRHDPRAFGGFNLVLGDQRQSAWAWLSNRNPAGVHHDPDPQWHRQALGPGVYGLSNASLNVPWPKTQRLVPAVQTHQPQANRDWPAEVLQALADQNLGAGLADHDLPNTGLSLVTERALANPFVHWPEHRYGTRTSTLLSLTAAEGGWQLRMSEWTHPTDQLPFTASPRRDLNLHWGQIPNT
jgi:uncharacterized protein with NRDE domain